MFFIDKSKLKQVTSHKIYRDSKFNSIDQDGLLSEKIFGPIFSYKCACKKYSSKSLHRGLICPDCNVECISSDIRYTRFGKIDLPYPVYNIYKLKKIKHILGKNNSYLIDPKQNDLAISLKKFILYDYQNDKIKIVDSYGPRCIPINITGIFTLYLALKSIYNIFKSKNIKLLLNIFINDLLVIPPECRVSSKGTNTEGKEQLLRNKLDDLYSQIVYLSNFNLQNKLNIEDILKKIEKNYVLKNKKYIDNELLKTADTVTSRFQYYINDIYTNIAELLSGKSGYIRKYFLGRTIDFSSRSVVTMNPKLKAYEITIPKKIFTSLYFMEYLRFLKFVKKRPYNRLLYYVKMTDMFYKDLEYVEEFISYFFKNSDTKNRLVLINRQPTLWRYGIPSVEVVGVNNENVIMVSPLIISAMEMDYDGDTVALYKCHSYAALNELYEKAFILNNIKFDHNNNFINILHSEAIYALNLLLDLKVNTNLKPISYNDVKYDYELLNELERPVLLKNKEYPFGIAILNKWLDFDDIKIISNTAISDIYEIIFKNSLDNEDYYRRLTNLEKYLNWFLSSNSKEILTLPFTEAVEVVENENSIVNKLPKNPYIGNTIYDAIVEKKYNQIPKDFQLYKLSKVKFKKRQFAKSVIGIGYLADDHNIISSHAVGGSLLAGLTKEEFFNTTYGARKGITDKAKAVPQSGYLERSMVMNLSPIEVSIDDCKTNFGFSIEIQNLKHATSLENKYFYNNKSKLELFTKNHFNMFLNKTIYFRSPITCAAPNFKICKTCFGEYKNIKSKYVGILAGQYISERLTQLSMSSFHTSGSATLPINNEIKNFIQYNLIDILNTDYNSTLIFNKNIPTELYSGFQAIPFFEKLVDNKVEYNNIDNVENQDITVVVKTLNSLLKTEKQNINSIQHTYSEFMKNILDINLIYSTFIEILLCNLYVNKDLKIIRYALKDNEDFKIFKKFGIKQIHSILSPILSLLYQPNQQSVSKIKQLKNIETESLSIFEKIWLGKL